MPLKIVRIKITVGFSHTEFPNYYKKGEGQNLGKAIQSMLESSHSRLSQEEFDLLLTMSNSLEEIDLVKIKAIQEKFQIKKEKESIQVQNKYNPLLKARKCNR